MTTTSDTTRPETGHCSRVLIVEDDPSIVLGLRMNLEAEGYLVTTAVDGQRGLELALARTADVVILDVMLPKKNGFEVVSELRRQHCDVPVIMLSARGAESDKVMGLELGAEDYITKPFGLAELLARVRVALRRGQSAGSRAEPRFRAGNLEVSQAAREVVVDSKVVPLTATEFDILWCLIQAGGGVLSREEILAQVWGAGHSGTLRTIDNFLLNLRNKLEVNPAKPRHLLTVRGVGYRFETS